MHFASLKVCWNVFIIYIHDSFCNFFQAIYIGIHTTNYDAGTIDKDYIDMEVSHFSASAYLSYFEHVYLYCEKQ